MLFRRARLDGVWFHRSLDNFADDSVLLNTGISFPIAFAHGTVEGFEAKFEAPRCGPVSGFLSYGNLAGRGRLPVAGGLFLGDEAADLVAARGTFRITQDQRNTVRARVHFHAGSHIWFAAGGSYNSALPVELDEGVVDQHVLASQYGPEILQQVNFDRERVRTSGSLDLSAGLDLRRSEGHRVRFQADVLNVTGRLNVINFAGLFSGTALAPRRNFALRLYTEF